jgi:Domain of unknown function (DUF4388)
MKLEGSLDAFSLPDVFQLLSFTKKSGGLHLASDGCDGCVFFTGGQITGASADGSRQPLARRLIGAGAVDDDALTAAVQAATQGEDMGVVKALLENGVIEAGLLRQAVTDQSVDAVFDLLRWQQGDFAFVIDEINPDDVGVSLSIEEILADAESRRASWDSVSLIVPSPQALLSMPVVLPDDPHVSREEWSLLALVDGRRSVAELVDLTGSGQYAVVSTLAGLVTRGLLEVREVGDSSDDHVGVVVRRQGLLAALEGAPFHPVRSSPPAFEVEAAKASAPQPSAPQPSGPEHSAPEHSSPEHSASEHRSIQVEVEMAEAGDHRADDAGPGHRSDAAPDLAPQHAQAPSHGAAEDDVPTPGLVTVANADVPITLVGVHVPGDVVPPRPEPFLPRRQADFDESTPSPATRPMPMRGGGLGNGGVIGANAVALDPDAVTMIERDPNVNRSLMLRLIAGVRGL